GAMPPERDSLWYQSAPERVDGRSRGLAALNEFAAKLARACEDHLMFERRHFHRLPEPEVEEVTRTLPDYPDGVVDLDDLMPMLKDIRSRHWVAASSHGFERRRLESREVPGHPDQSMVVEVRPEHPVNTWVTSLPGHVVLALIRENPKWLRN